MTKKTKEKKVRKGTKSSRASARASAKATVKHGRDKIIVVQGASSSSGGGGASSAPGVPSYFPMPMNAQGPMSDWIDVHQRYTDALENRLAQRLHETQDQLDHLHSSVKELRSVSKPPSHNPDHPPSVDMMAATRNASVQANDREHVLSVTKDDAMSDMSDEYSWPSGSGLSLHEAAVLGSVHGDTSVPPMVNPALPDVKSPGSSVASSSVHMLGPASVNTVDLPPHIDLSSTTSSHSSSSKKPPNVKYEIKKDPHTSHYDTLKMESALRPVSVKLQEQEEFPAPTEMVPYPEYMSNQMVVYERPAALRLKNDSKRLAWAPTSYPPIDTGSTASSSKTGSSEANGSKASSSKASHSKASSSMTPLDTDIRRVPNFRTRLAKLENAQREVQDIMRKHKPLPPIAQAYGQHVGYV